MPKQLINIIGLIVSIGIIALGVVLVAIPVWIQSLAVDAQTATASETNQMYQVQVDALLAEQERIDEIDASVAGLRAEIPAAADLDDVFEVIAKAANSSGVILSSATAGEPAAFVVRTAPTAVGEGVTAPTAPAEDPDTESGGAGDGSGEAETEPAPEGGATEATPEQTLPARQEIDFAISATANDMAQATAFLDALRSGPRLLSLITAVTNQTGTAVDVQITALTFVDMEG